MKYIWQISDYLDIIWKIKSISNLIQIGQTVKHKISEAEETRHYPEAGLHPIVQAAIHRAYEDLKKKYPQLTDTDCKKDDNGYPRLYFTYRGKSLSSSLNLTGDTYTKVMQDVKRRIDPPKKQFARFISR